MYNIKYVTNEKINERDFVRWWQCPQILDVLIAARKSPYREHMLLQAAKSA